METDKKIKKIKAIIFDIDGVLTDGGIIYDDSGKELKRFNVKDGQIVSHLRKFGFVVGAITGRDSQVVRRRCDELKLDFHHHGISDKLALYKSIKDQFDLDDEEIAYIGDDIIDLAILSRCGFSATPNDAREYIKRNVDYITPSNGGDGAFRDFADHILQKQGLLDSIIQEYINEE